MFLDIDLDIDPTIQEGVVLATMRSIVIATSMYTPGVVYNAVDVCTWIFGCGRKRQKMVYDAHSDNRF